MTNPEYVISAIATTSLKEILKTQVSQNKTIWRIEANSIIENCPFNKDLSMPMLGINVFKGNKIRFSLGNNYEKKNQGAKYQHDEIRESQIKKIKALLLTLGFEDIPVQELSILIKSPELTDVLRSRCGCSWINPKETHYIARFVSEQCDGDLEKDKLKKFKVNKNLIKHHGFKHFVLNLNYLMPHVQHALPRKNKRFVVDARKKRYIETQNSYRLAKTLKDIWGKYGMTKQFKKGKEDRFVLVKVS